jgi:hypothetical protein
MSLFKPLEEPTGGVFVNRENFRLGIFHVVAHRLPQPPEM